jgi:2-hydroxychromene-2-carboxylate isomerase
VRPLLREEGFDADDLLDRANEPTNKARLKGATDAAIAQGAFGVPTMIADGELFWGFDSFAHLERFLDGKDTLDEGIVRAWETLPATAVRKR